MALQIEENLIVSNSHKLKDYIQDVIIEAE
jgi:hypothetical protein